MTLPTKLVQTSDEEDSATTEGLPLNDNSVLTVTHSSDAMNAIFTLKLKLSFLIWYEHVIYGPPFKSWIYATIVANIALRDQPWTLPSFVGHFS